MSVSPASRRLLEPALPAVETPVLTAGGLQQLVVPDEDYAERLRELAGGRRNVPRGAVLYRSGERLTSLYVVQSGLFKTCILHEDGRSQVTGFQLSGEWLGIDGIGTESHQCDTVALEDSQVCSIAYDELEGLLHDSPELLRQFQRTMSRHIVRCQDMMMMLGSMCAEKRVATFLLDLTQRLEARGGSGSTLVLPMTREEIGSYLGLKLETVSRMFSRLRSAGVLEITQRHVHVLDMSELQRVAHSPLP